MLNNHSLTHKNSSNKISIQDVTKRNIKSNSNVNILSKLPKEIHVSIQDNDSQLLHDLELTGRKSPNDFIHQQQHFFPSPPNNQTNAGSDVKSSLNDLIQKYKKSEIATKNSKELSRTFSKKTLQKFIFQTENSEFKQCDFTRDGKMFTNSIFQKTQPSPVERVDGLNLKKQNLQQTLNNMQQTNMMQSQNLTKLFSDFGDEKVRDDSNNKIKIQQQQEINKLHAQIKNQGSMIKGLFESQNMEEKIKQLHQLKEDNEKLIIKSNEQESLIKQLQFGLKEKEIQIDSLCNRYEKVANNEQFIDILNKRIFTKCSILYQKIKVLTRFNEEILDYIDKQKLLNCQWENTQMKLKNLTKSIQSTIKQSSSQIEANSDINDNLQESIILIDNLQKRILSTISIQQNQTLQALFQL